MQKFLIHGMWEGGWIYQEVEKYLDSDEYQVTELPVGNGVGIMDYVEHTEDEVLNSESIPPYHLVGHSLGGLIATFVTARNPLQISKLTLINSAPIGRNLMSTEVRGKIWSYLPSIWRGELFELSYEDACALELNEMQTEQAKKIYSRMSAESGRVAWELALMPFSPLCPVPPPEINLIETQHRQVIGGDQDRITPPYVQRTNAKLLGVVYEELSGGHMLPLEQPERIAARINEL